MDAMDAMAIVEWRGKCKWEDKMCTMCRCKGVIDVCIARRLYTCDVLAQSPREKGPDKAENTRESGKRPRQRAKHTAIYTHGTCPAASREPRVAVATANDSAARRLLVVGGCWGRPRTRRERRSRAGGDPACLRCVQRESLCVYPARWAGRAGRRCLDKLRFASDERLLGVWVSSLVCGFIRVCIEVRLYVYTSIRLYLYTCTLAHLFTTHRTCCSRCGRSCPGCARGSSRAAARTPCPGPSSSWRRCR